MNHLLYSLFTALFAWNLSSAPLLTQSAPQAASVLTNTLSLTAGYAKYTTNIVALDFTKASAFSFGGWMKNNTSGSTTDEYMFSKFDNAASGGWYMYNNAANALDPWCGLQGSATQIYIYLTTTITDNAWHHVWCTYSGSNNVSGLKMYIDGSLATTTASVLTTIVTDINAAKPFTIRATKNAGAYSYPFNGNLNNLAVYNIELTSGNISTMYNSGKAKDLSLLSTYSNCVGWWRLGNSASDTTSTLIDTKSGNDLTGVTATLGASAP